ncbi:MAG: hypothetical protein M3011_04145 [Actinomycetota bacterium]|nr:hypothetical protein [Actinomycetota bacterium]
MLLACVPAWTSVRGVDWAAQVYRVGFFKAQGWVPYDTSWYGGYYPLSYSSVFPLLASHLPLGVVAVVSAGAATRGFRCLLADRFAIRSPWASACFVLTTTMEVAVGQLPFLLGVALATATFVLARRRWWLFAVGTAVASSCASPVAGLFCGLAAVAWMVTSSEFRARGAALAAAAGVPLLVSFLLFPGWGRFPFSRDDLLFIGLVAAALHLALPRRWPTLRAGIGIYLAGTVVCFVVPNALGDNVTRLATAAGVPLVAAGWWLRDRRRSLALLAVPLVAWQLAPMAASVAAGSIDPSQSRLFFAPLLTALGSYGAEPARVEVVPTRDHWEAAWVAPHLPLARGWYRQADIARNPLFYDPDPLTDATYEQWLRATGVRWVAVPDVRLDWSAGQESDIVRSQPAYLQPVWTNAHWKLFAVTRQPSLVDGPATLQNLSVDTLRLHFDSAGTALVRVGFTPDWSVVEGAACVTASPDGWTRITTSRPGEVQLKAILLPVAAPGCRG